MYKDDKKKENAEKKNSGKVTKEQKKKAVSGKKTTDEINAVKETISETKAIASDSSCPYFKKCGGCRYLNMSYEEQLKLKQGIVSKNLKELAVSQNIKIEKIVGTENPFNYRNKVHSVFSRNGAGKIVRGIYREDTHKVVNVSGCLIEDKLADEIIEEVKRLLPSFKYKVYDEDNGTGWLRHVLVRVGHSYGSDLQLADRGHETENDSRRVTVMLVLVTATVPFAGKNNFISAIRLKYPQITTIIQNINDKRTSMVLGERNIVCYGPGYIEDNLLGLNFRISPSAFYQVNHEQAEKLYGIAKELAAPSKNDIVTDAYCGTGTIGLCMASSAKEVFGVELNGEAVKDASFNAKRNKIENIRFVKADATEWMVSYAQYDKENPTDKTADGKKILIMDPPRSGSTPEFIKAAAAMKFDRVVYVSCNPETLARDLRNFIKSGYRLERIIPVDMFPWTEHVETVVLMSKVNTVKG